MEFKVELTDEKFETLVGVLKGMVTTTPKKNHDDIVYQTFKTLDDAIEPLAAKHYGSEWPEIKKAIIDAAKRGAKMAKETIK